MKIEKNKIYKIKRPRIYDYPRDYIICAFKKNITINNDFFEEYNPLRPREVFKANLDTVFTLCFTGEVVIDGNIDRDNPHGSSQTGISNYCTFLPLEGKDYDDIRKAIRALGGKYKYNRKLNKLIIETYEGNR